MKLIINADDFGLRPGIDRGVRLLLEAGAISSVSVLVNQSSSRDALSFLQRNPQFGAGLHLDLDSYFYEAGFCTDHRGKFLVPELFFDNPVLLQRIADDLQEQIERFADCVGRKPDHLDGHHHVHLFPAVLPMVVKYLVEAQIPAVRFIKSFYQLSSERAAAMELLEKNGIAFAEKLVIGTTLPPAGSACSTEMLVHPAADLPEEEPWRIEQLRQLLSGAFQRKLQAGGFKMIKFSDLETNCHRQGYTGFEINHFE